jgi:hypothetical protein
VHVSALQRLRRFQDKLLKNKNSTVKKSITDKFVVSAFTVAILDKERLVEPIPKFIK